jgi:hemerythrin
MTARVRGILAHHRLAVRASERTFVMTLQWTSTLSVGVTEIDEEHQELFRRAGRLLDALGAGERAEVVELVEFLHGYAVRHFDREETWMRETLYPGYVRHKLEHDRFVADLRVLSRDLDMSVQRALAPFPLGRWLAQWLKDHVGGTDKELGRYLARRSA